MLCLLFSLCLFVVVVVVVVLFDFHCCSPAAKQHLCSRLDARQNWQKIEKYSQKKKGCNSAEH